MSSHESEELDPSPKMKGAYNPFQANFMKAFFDIDEYREPADSEKKYRKKSVDLSNSSIDLYDDQAKGGGDRGVREENNNAYDLSRFLVSKPAMHDSAHEAPHLIQQSAGAKTKAPVVEDLLGASAASGKKPMLLSDMPASEDPLRDGEIAREPDAAGKMREFERGKILKDVERAPMSKKAPAKLERGFGDNLMSLGKGLGSFALWALFGLGLGGALGAGWSSWRMGANRDKAEALQRRIADRNMRGMSDTREGRAAHLKLQSKLAKYHRKAEMHGLNRDRRWKFASGYQWRKRLGLLSGKEKTDIYNAATSEGNDLWRHPDFGDKTKPLATWRDARDVVQGRNADPIPEGAGDAEAEPGPEQEMLQPTRKQMRQQSQDSSELEDDHAVDVNEDDEKAFANQLKFYAKLAEREQAEKKAKRQAELAEAGKGPVTAAKARMMSKQLSQARASERLTARQTSSRQMMANLGATTAKAPVKQLPEAIIEEEEGS